MRWPLLVFAAACSHSALPAPTVTKETKETPETPELDVLFVLDNTEADVQTVLASNFVNFVSALDALPGGRPNLHIGFIDTSVDLGQPLPGCPSPDPTDNGLLQNTARVPGCTAPTGRFISDVAGTGSARMTNYSGALDQAMACIAQVGASGCGFQSPLLAIERALDGTRPENAGFLRPGAALAIFVLAMDDDCSVVDPSIFSDPPRNALVCTEGWECDQPISLTSPGTYTGCKPRSGGRLLDLDEAQQTFATLKDPSLTSFTVLW